MAKTTWNITSIDENANVLHWHISRYFSKEKAIRFVETVLSNHGIPLDTTVIFEGEL